MAQFFTLGQVAERFGCEIWQVRRLFERGILPPADRIGQYRIVSEEDLPVLEAALVEAGYVKRNAAAAQ